jgi:uncharacterized protein GlcG (DUF336 family)
MKLTDDVSTRMLGAAIEAANKIGVQGSIAVVDEGGNLVGFLRMDGALLGSVEGAIRKAKTSVMSGMSTASWFETYSANTTFGQIVALGSSDMLFLPGGEPVRDSNDHLVGAVGFSGGTPDQDLSVVQAALAIR